METPRSKRAFICDMNDVDSDDVVVGKPNPLIMRHAIKQIGCRREETVIVGDRMDTDIIAGIESEIATVLVLAGVTTASEIGRFAYRPDVVLPGDTAGKACGPPREHAMMRPSAGGEEP